MNKNNWNSCQYNSLLSFCSKAFTCNWLIFKPVHTINLSSYIEYSWTSISPGPSIYQLSALSKRIVGPPTLTANNFNYSNPSSIKSNFLSPTRLRESWFYSTISKFHKQKEQPNTVLIRRDVSSSVAARNYSVKDSGH